MEHLQFLAACPFEGARSVSIFPEGHRSRRLHGHSFTARLRTSLPSAWAPHVGAECEALEATLRQAVAPLDYAHLNEIVPIPSDENLARWVREALAKADRTPLTPIESVGIQSTRDQGADLDAHGHAHLWRRFHFEAAHRLPHVHEGHPCGRMHGHGFEVVLHVDRDLAATEALGVDFDRLAEAWAPFHRELDHHCLNDIPGLENPTSEMLAAWLWNKLKGPLPSLSWVTVYETITAGCHFDGKQHRIWKEQRFEAAIRHARAPMGHPGGRLHGHSYLLRLHLLAPLDKVLGWTVDYGDVKRLFGPVYRSLDHHRLDEIPGLESGGLPDVLRYMRRQSETVLPQLDRIDLFEKPGCGALLSWGPEAPALPA